MRFPAVTLQTASCLWPQVMDINCQLSKHKIFN